MPVKVRRRRLTEAAKALTPKSRPQPGRCNYLSEGKFCRMGAGRGTDHPGSGYCRTHDLPTAVDPVHRYRYIKKKSLRKQLEQLSSAERDYYDLLPEIILMRALMVDYINRFYVFRDAVIQWYRDGKLKPKYVMDIKDASDLIEAVSRLIQRAHTIKSRGSISLETFRAATEQMGIIVAKHVKDGKVLAAIEADWSNVSLDANAPSALPLPDVTVQQLGPVDADEED